VAGLRGLPLLGDYVAAKHGVTGLAKTMANELGQYNIRVNSVLSEPEDIASAVAWLASDEARHVTGIQLPVDLGRTNR
jgi:NAD(P)-dependent dehydrogenase (short-subunit alcohol dehydrogenase family)